MGLHLLLEFCYTTLTLLDGLHEIPLSRTAWGHVLLGLDALEPKRARHILFAEDLFELSKLPKLRTFDVLSGVVINLSGYQGPELINLGQYDVSNVPSLKGFCEMATSLKNEIETLKALSAVMVLLQSNITASLMKDIGKNCAKLCTLDISNVRNVTDNGVGHIANGLAAVKSLTFSRQGFSDVVIASLIERCGKSLKELSLNNVKKVSHQTAFSLCKCCENLEFLDISFCCCLTKEDVGLIAVHCSSLKILKLLGCTQVTKVFLEGYCDRNLKLLGPN